MGAEWRSQQPFLLQIQVVCPFASSPMAGAPLKNTVSLKNPNSGVKKLVASTQAKKRQHKANDDDKTDDVDDDVHRYSFDAF